MDGAERKNLDANLADESGLFDDFLGEAAHRQSEGGPFQLQVRKFGKQGERDPSET